jgi:hypothetical protein
MPRTTWIIAVALAAGLLALACDEGGDGEPATTQSPESAAQSSVVTSEPDGPMATATHAPSETPAATVTVPDAPSTPTQAPANAAADGITIELTEFSCDRYEFEVTSQPAALSKVHWTSMSPAAAGPSDSRSVSDAEVSQSPGEHTFRHAQDGWTETGTNELRIAAEDINGLTSEDARTITC